MGKRFSIDEPCVTIMTAGTKTIDKPTYTVPSMENIKAIPWNGLKVASTFSGCGGSCLGYRMGGFRVVWANEFVPAAQASYNANKSEHCYLDGRDIRTIQASEILERCNLEEGELDLLDGSPPCQAFSTAGKRHKGWGKTKTYEHGAKQCNEQLFNEYIRLVRDLQPKAFIAENVSGLVKGTAKGMFIEILAGLKACGYRVKCKVLDAQWLGVPQQRKRVIFIGVRNDLKQEAAFPKPLLHQYSVKDALPFMQNVSNKRNPKRKFYKPLEANSPAPTVACGPGNWEGAVIKTKTENIRRKFTIAELKRICAFPDDFVLTGSYSQQWERLGNSAPPLMMKAIAEPIRDHILNRQEVLT